MAALMASVFSAQAFTWPAAGGTATLPAGETVEVTSNADLAAAAACGEIVIPAGSTLSFTNITANATFAGAFSGAGRIQARNASGTYRLTFTGDLSGFTGDLDFYHVFATFNTAQSGSFPMKFVEENTALVIFTGSNTYANPIDFNGGPNQGLRVDLNATISGDITWRDGSLRGNSSAPAAGGMVTGTIYVPDASIYIEGGVRMLGPELKRSSSGGTVIVDGSSLALQAKIVNFTALHTYRQSGLITFLAEDLVPANCALKFGVSYAYSGAIDLNGFDQKCSCITIANEASKPDDNTIDSKSGPATFSIVGAQGNVKFPGLINSHATLNYASTSANTLSLTGGVHKTDGAIRVTKGKLAITSTAKFANLSELEVSGTGNLTVESSEINPARVVLKLADSGKLTVAAGVTMIVGQALVNGANLEPGIYTKDSPAVSGYLDGNGAISVLNMEKTTEGATFTWVGEGADMNFTTAANWQGGEAPAFDGTERLVLGGGAHTANVDTVVKAYAIDVVDSNKFVITSSDSGKILLGAGGFCFTNTVTTITNQHSLFAPVELTEIPQHWMVAKNANMETTKPWTGLAGGPNAALVIHSFGRVSFWGDNSGLETTLMLTNCTTVASQPYVYNEKGLGATNRETWVSGCLPRFYSTTRALTNNVPLRLKNNVTNAEHGHFKNNNDFALYLDAPVTFWGGQSETFVYNNVHFRGGIVMESTSLYTFRKPGSNSYIEGGVRCAGTFAIDYGGTFHLMSADNSWTRLDNYKCTIKFYVANALPADKPVRMSDGGVYHGSTVLDLNGCDQTSSRLYSGLTNDDRGSYTATITSETPAVFSLSGTDTSNDWGPFRFTGAASLVYDKGGSLQMTNKLSTTTGTLDVRQGTVKFLKGSGWTAGGTNVVLRGGTIAVAKDAGATAFGSAQGVSATWMRYESGTLDVLAGEQATVRTVLYTANGREKSLVPGVYWASDTAQNVTAGYKLAWLTGGGSLRVLKSAIPLGTMMFLR